MAGAAVQCRLYRSEQLLGVGESVLQRMAYKIGIAQAKEMFSRRIEIGYARLLVQQNNCCGNVFNGGELKGRHVNLKAENMPCKKIT
jgi:hypothetical protein